MGIPVLGGTIIIVLSYIPLAVMLIFHITNALAWIPFLGMVMHILTAVILLVSAYQDGKTNPFVS